MRDQSSNASKRQHCVALKCSFVHFNYEEIVTRSGPGNPHLRFWQGLALAQAVLLAVAAVALVGCSLPAYHRLSTTVTQLSSEVNRLRQQQSGAQSQGAGPGAERVAATLLSRYRGSICFIYAAYVLDRPPRVSGPDHVRYRVSGTGFVVADGVIASNKHVLQPEFEDPRAIAFIVGGAKPRIEKLIAYFPGIETAVPLRDVRASTSADVAVARFATPKKFAALTPLPLSHDESVPGDSVLVIGYPMGVIGMLAKSPAAIYEGLALEDATVEVAHDLAALSLIRPSATFGHVGDLVGDKLLYDAPTAKGGSGGPVFNSRGKVIAINSGYIRGFPGGTLGILVDDLTPLLSEFPRVTAG